MLHNLIYNKIYSERLGLLDLILNVVYMIDNRNIMLMFVELFMYTTRMKI